MIRPMEPGDVEEAANLFEFVQLSGSGRASQGLVDQLQELYFDHPWADPEVPPLVYTDRTGRIRAFIGSHVRRFRFRDRPVRLGVAGQLVSHPEVRAYAPGFFLTKAYLAGSHDLSLTDTANTASRAMLARLGAVSGDLLGINWLIVFRPWQLACNRLSRSVRPLATAVRPICKALDGFTSDAASGEIAITPGLASEPLSPSLLVDSVAALSDSILLRPQYDAPFVSWLFDQMATGRTETLVATHLSDSEGASIGWYVYLLEPGGTSSVYQLGASRETMGHVIDHLLWHARENGSAAVTGRLEPVVTGALAGRRCLLRNRSQVILSGREELVDAVLAGRAFLSRLDGDAWLRFGPKVWRSGQLPDVARYPEAVTP
jgi:hypothetical protein